MRPLAAAFLIVLSTVGCGYHIAGQADTIPDTVATIAVEPFENITTEYKIEQYLTAAVTRELIARTRYRVINDPAEADAVLTGAVVGFIAYPQNFDQVTNRASTVSTITRLQVTLRERDSGDVIYQNPNMEHRDRYEVSTSPDAYFEERQAALTRSSQSMARTLVSAVLEGF